MRDPATSLSATLRPLKPLRHWQQFVLTHQAGTAALRDLTEMSCLPCRNKASRDRRRFALVVFTASNRAASRCRMDESAKYTLCSCFLFLTGGRSFWRSSAGLFQIDFVSVNRKFGVNHSELRE